MRRIVRGEVVVGSWVYSEGGITTTTSRIMRLEWALHPFAQRSSIYVVKLGGLSSRSCGMLVQHCQLVSERHGRAGMSTETFACVRWGRARIRAIILIFWP